MRKRCTKVICALAVVGLSAGLQTSSIQAAAVNVPAGGVLMALPSEPAVSQQILSEQRMRSQFGLRGDLAYIVSLHSRARNLLHVAGDSPYVQNLPDHAVYGLDYRMGALVTSAEAADLDQRLAVQNFLQGRPAGGEVTSQQRDFADYLSAHSASYAGMYIDQGGGGVVHVLFTRDVAQADTSLRRLFPYPSRLVVEGATHTLAYLQSLQAAADVQSARTASVRGVIATIGVDVPTNTVAVGVTRDESEVKNWFANTFPGAPFSIHLSQAQVAVDRHDVNAPPARGGQFITHPFDLATVETECTSAFIVFTLNGGAYTYYLATAGHCGGQDQSGVGTDWYNGDSFFYDTSTCGITHANLDCDYYEGNMTASEFCTGCDDDAAVIQASDQSPSGWANQIEIQPTVNRTVTAALYSPPPVGAAICMSGSTSGGEQCTTVLSTGDCVSEEDSNGNILADVCNQDRTGYNAMPGDSGGSWYEPGSNMTATAVGITTTTNFYIEIGPALNGLPGGPYQVLV